MAIDGNVYVVDYSGTHVQKFDANGNFLTAWDSQGTGDGQFREAHEALANASGDVCIADLQNHRVQKFGNVAPVAVNDSYEVNEDEVLEVLAPGMLANDTDANGDAISIYSTGSQVNGTRRSLAGGGFALTPNKDFNGQASFGYTAMDPSGLTSDRGTATITVSSRRRASCNTWALMPANSGLRCFRGGRLII